MNAQQFFDGLILIAVTFSGWVFIRQEKIYDRMSEFPNIFARRDDLKTLEEQILEMLHRIEDKVDNKADKS